MNYTKLILSCTTIAVLLSLTGCAKKCTYKPRQLKSLKESIHVDFQETKEQVTVRAKAFTKDNCKNVFGERADRITNGKNPLRPIQLCIENNSSSLYELLDSNIDLPMVPAKDVTTRLSSCNKFIAGGICGGIGLCGILVGIASLIAAPVACPCCILIPFLFYAGIGSLFVAASPFAFLIDNCGTRTENKEIRNYLCKNMERAIIVNPGKTIDVLLFVQEKMYQPQFKLTLVNADDQSKKKLPFVIKLHE